MKLLKAFFVGMSEFRISMTTSYNNENMRVAYDRGRDMAHRLTLRRYED